MNVEVTRELLLRFMGEQYVEAVIPQAKRVDDRIEPAVKIPEHALRVMVSTHQYLTGTREVEEARQLGLVRENDVPQVNKDVVLTYAVLQLLEGPVAVKVRPCAAFHDAAMIKMGVRDHPYLWCIFH